ncbi:ABC transporter permease [Amycolatopsis pithecellobii]|uniref:ABC transporter permease n=1 Tax=Amycolatopsis pithecellobii TaxID=664692 RepID=A0A6N7YVX3_9PSEU|nr:ABC transporter permease [Amycolatopsis pithecellobii]MTD53023.1 ABC transporter permease [Amycolatopsis pithecellobii]
MTTSIVLAIRGTTARATRVRLGAALALAALNALLVLLTFRSHSGTTKIDWSVSGRETAWTIPSFAVPTSVAAVLGAVGLLAAGLAVSRGGKRHLGGLLTLSGIVAVLATLVLCGAGQTVSLLALADESMARAAPLVLAALGGVLCERAGVINVAIEGQLLFGAFVGAIAGSAGGSGLVGVLFGVVAGVAIGALFATLAIRFKAEQLVVGIVLNTAIAGLTGFFVSGIFIDTPSLNNTPTIGAISIPLLGDVPVLGPLLFHTSPYVWLAVVLAFVVNFILERSRIGRHITAVGENPRAADAVGINVQRVRFWATVAGGLIIGTAGTYFTVGSVGQFSIDMTGGRGFIALAAVILGAWRPAGAIAAAALFGFADALQLALNILGAPIPSPLLLCLPYVVTIIAIVARGQVRAPSADGVPYERN